MKIKGKFTDIERVRMPCPKDGIHKASSEDGTMKGCHSMWFESSKGRKLVMRGATSFYYQHRENKGVKVYYSVKHGYATPRRIVIKEFKYRQIFHKHGLSPKGNKIIKLSVDIRFRNKHYKGTPYGLVTKHVDYPIEIWEKYSRGIPYDFMGLDQKEHPEHNPAGYLKFCKKVKKIIAKYKMDIGGGKPSLKIGDIVYSVKEKKWYLVDCL